MGDIKPKRPKGNPPPDSSPNPIQDSALGEAPGESVTMPDIAGWNAEASEPVPPPKGYFPPVDLIGAWQRASAPPPPPPPPAGQAVPAPPPPAEGLHLPVSNRLLVILTTLGVLVVAGLGGTYYLFFRPEAPAPQPVAVATPSPISTPSARPTFRPTPRPIPSTVPGPAQPPLPGQRTYTVVAGDTLITIGERLGVDWRQIAAANGQITDPNFITPGQILKIP